MEIYILIYFSIFCFHETINFENLFSYLFLKFNQIIVINRLIRFYGFANKV